MILTPDLAARMLTVYRRRLLDRETRQHPTTLLEAALALPSAYHMRHVPPNLGRGSYLARPKYQHQRGADRRGNHG